MCQQKDKWKKIVAPIFDISIEKIEQPIKIFETKKYSLKVQALSEEHKERVHNFTKDCLGFECQNFDPAYYELEFSYNEEINQNTKGKAKYCFLWAWQAMWLALPNRSYMPFFVYPKEDKEFSKIEWKPVFFDRMGYGANNHYPPSFSTEHFKETVPIILKIALKNIDHDSFLDTALGRFRHWHYAAITEKEVSMRLIHHISALECFLKKWKGDAVADEIVELLVEKNLNFKKCDCKTFIKNIYELRSNLVHGASLYRSIKTDAKGEQELFKWIESIYKHLPLKDLLSSTGKKLKKVKLSRPSWYS